MRCGSGSSGPVRRERVRLVADDARIDRCHQARLRSSSVGQSEARAARCEDVRPKSGHSAGLKVGVSMGSTVRNHSDFVLTDSRACGKASECHSRGSRIGSRFQTNDRAHRRHRPRRPERRLTWSPTPRWSGWPTLTGVPTHPESTTSRVISAPNSWRSCAIEVLIDPGRRRGSVDRWRDARRRAGWSRSR